MSFITIEFKVEAMLECNNLPADLEGAKARIIEVVGKHLGVHDHTFSSLLSIGMYLDAAETTNWDLG